MKTVYKHKTGYYQEFPVPDLSSGDWTAIQVNDDGTKVVYNTTTKEPKTISAYEDDPVGYTSQVPKEFDYWDGSLWITDLQLRNTVLKQRKLTEINHAMELALASLRIEYPESEIMSWTKQESEARLYLINPNHKTPLLDLIVESRGMDKLELINKVILKAEQYAFAVGMAVGRRQMLEDQIKAIKVGEENKLAQIQF